MIYFALGFIILLFLYSKWCMFEAANEKGWKGMIPILDKYVMFQFSWRIEMFYVYLVFLLIFIGSVFGLFMETEYSTVLYTMSLASYIILCIIHLSLQYHLSKYFQLNLINTIGMIVLYPVFIVQFIQKRG